MTLNVRNTPVCDIEILTELPNLRMLDLHGTQINDIEVLKRLTNLTNLMLL